nr:hypothetical protein Iba_chr11dCG10310 [Ipomoea batatas]
MRNFQLQSTEQDIQPAENPKSFHLDSATVVLVRRCDGRFPINVRCEVKMLPRRRYCDGEKIGNYLPQIRNSDVDGLFLHIVLHIGTFDDVGPDRVGKV